MSALYTQISQAAAEQQQQVERSRASDQPNFQPETATDAPALSEPQPDRTVNPNDRALRPNGLSGRTEENPDIPMELGNGNSQRASRSNPESVSLIDEMQHGVEEDVRQSERYSFEIYTDQKETILEIKYRYEKRTGKRLPKSRIIREALDAYFQRVRTVDSTDYE